MNLTYQWMQSEWMKALGWTFVHSLWQITLIGFLLYIILRCIPGRSAHMRYTISTMALLSIVIMALCTFIIMLPATTHITEIAGKVIWVGDNESLSWKDKASLWLESRMPMMLVVWLGGVGILMIRLLVSLGWVKHIRATATPDVEIQDALDRILQRLHLKGIASASSSGLVSSPVTIGHFKPLILFPIAIINQLTPREVEAILTHELAHIVRRDYLSNIIQSFIETLFYYHPVTWWISRMVRAERENRADDLAISWCGDHLGYAKALLTVQEMQAPNNTSLAIGFASRKGAMLARIQRILNIPYKSQNQMEKTVLLSLCTLCFLAFTVTHQPEKEEPKEQSITLTTTLTATAEQLDSIPTKGTYRIHKKTDEQDISIEVEDGDIKELSIDGKEIAPSEFDEYGEVIEELFSGIETQPSMDGFAFEIPPMPPMSPMAPMPAMPPMMEDFHIEMPGLPDMPEMPEELELELRHLYDGEHFKFFGDDGSVILNGEGLQGMKIMCDSTPDGQTKIIIIQGGDSSVICTPRFDYKIVTPDGEPYMLDMNGMKLKLYDEHWKEQEKIWKEQEKHWKDYEKQWKKQGEQWRQYGEQWRQHGEQWRAEQERMREEPGGHPYWNEDQQQAIEREMRIIEHQTPRLSLSDELVRDGIIEPGDEVEVQLTPDKLKVNGEKMPDHIHEKYLRMYERQQGVELSDNSRVVFTTKSKQRM